MEGKGSPVEGWAEVEVLMESRMVQKEGETGDGGVWMVARQQFCNWKECSVKLMQRQKK